MIAAKRLLWAGHPGPSPRIPASLLDRLDPHHGDATVDIANASAAADNRRRGPHWSPGQHKVAWPEMGGDAVFTADEYRYLAARRDGRLVTIGAGDAPQIHPVSFRIDADGGAIEIGGPRIRDTQKYRNIRGPQGVPDSR